MIASSDEDEEKTSRCGLSAFNTATYTSLLSGNEPYFLLEDSGSHPASPMLLWWVMVRTFSGGAYQWRLGRVESLVPQVINLDEDRTAPSSANEPNVVVDFESGCERLSLRVDNFSDGDDDGGDEGDGRGGHSLCWFRIEETATVERDRRRKALRARKALEDRTGRRRQVERGCGQCGFRAVMEKGGPKRKVATEEGASKKPARVSVPPVQSMAAKYGFPHKHPPKQKKIAANPDQKNSGTHKDPRCKRCGRLKKSDVIAQGMHGNRVEKRSRAYCKVDEEHYMPGYPKRGYEDLE